MIFCEIDDELVGCITEIAAGRIVVDCGAGEGMLAQRAGTKLKVISLDIRSTDPLSVLPMDCTEFSFLANMLPVFIRPCHSDFVDVTITKNLDIVSDFLYISMPHNLEKDLDLAKYTAEQICSWVGKEGERVYRIEGTGAWMPKGNDLLTFRLIELDYGGTWWYEWAPHPFDGEMAYLNFAGGGFHSTREVLQEVQAEDFEDLDWSITSLCQPDSDAGWLDRAGRFHGCDPESHDTYARYMLKKKVYDLEETGWVRVYGKRKGMLQWSLGHRKGLRLSDEQRMWLNRKGYQVDEWD